MPFSEQVASMYAATRGFMDDVPVADIRKFESAYIEFLRNAKADILADLKAREVIDADIEGRLKAAIEEFKKTFSA
jgi:F-type H+-transporting ATPase subunit alpha